MCTLFFHGIILHQTEDVTMSLTTYRAKSHLYFGHQTVMFTFIDLLVKYHSSSMYLDLVTGLDRIFFSPFELSGPVATVPERLIYLV